MGRCVGDFWVDQPMEEFSAEEKACLQGTEAGGNVGAVGPVLIPYEKSVKVGLWERKDLKVQSADVS